MSVVDKSKNSLFIRLAPALLIVAAQILCYPILTQLYGEVGLTEIIILTTIFSSMAIGQLNFLSQRIISYLSFLVGTFLIFFGLFFSNLIIFFAENNLYRSLITAIFVLFIFLSGQLLLKGTYNNNNFNKNYTQINLLAFIFVVAGTLLLPIVGFSSLFICSGILLCTVSTKIFHLYHNLPKKSLNFNNESIRSIGFGIISAGFISCFFRVIYIGLYPTGYEFNIYLGLSFLLLTIASFAHKKIKRAFSTEIIVLTGLLLGLISLFLYFSGPTDHTFFFNPLKLYISLPSPIKNFCFYSIAFSTFFLVPYLFFAGIIPSRESKSKQINHLFFCSTGNVLGFILFGFLFIDLGIKTKYLILSSILFLLITFNIKNSTKHSLFLSFLLILGCLCLPSNLNQRIAAQGQYMWTTYANAPQNVKIYNQNNVKAIKNFTSSHGHVGYFYDIKYDTRLGFGGYSTTIDSRGDLQRAMTVRDLITDKTKKILILGLGNRIILQQAYAKLKIINNESFKIDIVDNFNLFYNKPYMSVIKDTLGFSIEKPEITLHYADAFQYLIKNKRQDYDLIIWNLTQPNYPASAKLYTKEGSKLIAAALKTNGVFVGKHYDFGVIDCSIISSFKYFSSFPSTTFNPFNSLIASNKPLKYQNYLDNNLFELASYCKNQKPITLDKYTKLIRFTRNKFRVDHINKKYRINKNLLKISESARLFNIKVNAPLNSSLSKVAILPLTGKNKEQGLSSYKTLNLKNKHNSFFTAIDSLSSSKLKKRYKRILNKYLNSNSFTILSPSDITNAPNNIKNILIATDLSGHKSQSGNHIKNAITLFTNKNNKINWNFKTLDSRSNEKLNAELTHKLYLSASPGSIIFAPRGSKASLEYIKLFPPEQHNKKHISFLNQITASTQFNIHYPTMSAFLPSERYLHGVLAQMKDTLPPPRKVHILRLENISYFIEIENQLEKDIENLDLDKGRNFIIKNTLPRDISKFINPDQTILSNPSNVGDQINSEEITKNDWIIFLDYGPSMYKNLNTPSEIFEKITKIYIYGSMQPFTEIPTEQQYILRNSWNALFWHKNLANTNFNSISSCIFSQEYYKKFKQSPDFHAAYTYASMELANALTNKNTFINDHLAIKTILGHIKWNNRGIRTNAYPLILHYGKNGEETLYTKGNYEWCPEIPKNWSFPIKKITTQ